MKKVSGLAAQFVAPADHLVKPGRKNGVNHRWFNRSSRFANEEGSALVEIALTLPVFLALITGVATFAIAFNNQETLTQATGSAAQYLQSLRGGTTDPCAATLTAVENAAPNLNSANIGLTLTLDGTVVNSTSCPGDQSYLTEGALVTVAATYPCNLSVYGMKFATSCQLSAQVTEYEY